MSSAVPLEMVVFVVACFTGAVIAGVAGFAFGLIASAIWLHAIAPAQSAALIAAFAIAIQGASLWKLRHAVQVSRLIPFFIGGMLGIPLGAEVLRWASPSAMRTFVGVRWSSSASTAWCVRGCRLWAAARSPTAWWALPLFLPSGKIPSETRTIRLISTP